MYKVGAPIMAFGFPATRPQLFMKSVFDKAAPVSMRFLPPGLLLGFMGLRDLQAEASFAFWDIMDQVQVGGRLGVLYTTPRARHTLHKNTHIHQCTHTRTPAIKR
mgnify:CR=1 FL=1